MESCPTAARVVTAAKAREAAWLEGVLAGPAAGVPPAGEVLHRANLWPAPLPKMMLQLPLRLSWPRTKCSQSESLAQVPLLKSTSRARSPEDMSLPPHPPQTVCLPPTNLGITVRRAGAEALRRAEERAARGEPSASACEVLQLKHILLVHITSRSPTMQC